VIRQGNPAEQILLVARQYNVDVIALTAKHRQFLDITVIGNTTEKVMRHADSTVLVIPVAGEQRE
jgi:nucleotide-binding universal stress UspA family protein